MALIHRVLRVWLKHSLLNKHLELLSVSDNALCDDGIQHLAHALRVNQGLKVLYLRSCGMTDVGLECLAKSLQHNNVLTRLDMYTMVFCYKLIQTD